MHVKKAVITAAGKGTRQYPATNSVQKELFPLVDTDGICKPTIHIIIEEIFKVGIEEIALIIQPDMEPAFRQHFQALSDEQKKSFEKKPWGLEQSNILGRIENSITYLYQTTQDGFGHAVYQAHEWVGDEPFLLLLGDHVYLSNSEESCAASIIKAFDKYQKSVFSVKHTPVDKIYLYGTVYGQLIDQNPNTFELEKLVEKPSIEFARENLQIDGVPMDTFLTFFGMYIFTSKIFEILKYNIDNDIRDRGEIQLTSAQDEICRQEGAIGLEIDGKVLDMGTPQGYIETQIALGLHGPFADQLKPFMEKMLKG